MRVPLPPTVVRRYYLYQATATFGFFWPVFTIFLLDRGLSFTEITLLNSLSAAFVVVGEVPTGYVGDRVGRRNSLVVGSLLYSASILGFVVADSFPEFVVLWVLWSFGTTFQSGADDAWLYDVLVERGDEDRYTRVRGRGGAVNMWVNAGTMLAAGVLYAVDPTLPFLAGGALAALGAVVLLTLPRSRRHAADEAFTVVDALPVLRRQLGRPPLRSFVLYVALFFGTVVTVDSFVQPILVGPVGLPESALGPVYTGFAAVAAVLSYYAGAIEEALTTRWAVVLVPLLAGVLLLVPLAVPLVAVPAFFVLKASRSVLAPIASGYVNEHAESVGRATVLSAASMVYALVRVPMQPLAGLVADLATPTVAVAALGGAFLAGLVLVHLWEAPVAGANGVATGSTD